MTDIITHALLIILAITVVALVTLYFLRNRLQKHWLERQQLIDAATQTVSILAVDEKKMKITQAGLPKAAIDQAPECTHWAKVPVAKTKISPKVMALIVDGRVFGSLPIKTKARVVISGIYIIQTESVRGDAIPTPPKKKGFFARLRKNK